MVSASLVGVTALVADACAAAVKPEVVLPWGGPLGALTIPFGDCAVLGTGRLSTGTELVTGKVEALGETALGSPNTPLLRNAGGKGDMLLSGLAPEER